MQATERDLKLEAHLSQREMSLDWFPCIGCLVECEELVVGGAGSLML